MTARDENNEGLTDIEIRNEVDTFLFEGKVYLAFIEIGIRTTSRQKIIIIGYNDQSCVSSKFTSGL